jgi:hypothetical protein
VDEAMSVSILVVDDGAGIVPEIRDKLFQPFVPPCRAARERSEVKENALASSSWPD